jgi:hypothetical protein
MKEGWEKDMAAGRRLKIEGYKLNSEAVAVVNYR